MVGDYYSIRFLCVYVDYVAQGPSDSVESTGAPPTAVPSENDSSSVALEKENSEQEREKRQKFPLWNWGWNENREEDGLKDANVDVGKVQANDDKQASTLLSTTIPVDNVEGLDDSVKATENLKREDTLWVRDETEASFQSEDSADDGNILWRRDEAEDENRQDSLSVSEMDRVFVVEDTPTMPTVSQPEWKPKVWPDPWLAITSVDNPITLEANPNLKSPKSGNGTAMPVIPVAPPSTPSGTEPLNIGDVDKELEKGERDRDDIWKPDQVEENLLSNVDTPNRFSAARIWGFVTRQSRSS